MVVIYFLHSALTGDQQPERECPLRERTKTQDQRDQRRGQLRDDERARGETGGNKRVPDHYRRDVRTKEQIAQRGEEEPKEDEREELDAAVGLDHPDALDHASECGER